MCFNFEYIINPPKLGIQLLKYTSAFWSLTITYIIPHNGEPFKLKKMAIDKTKYLSILLKKDMHLQRDRGIYKCNDGWVCILSQIM